ICEENDIPHKRLGKIVVANGEDEMRQLEDIFKNASECGARELAMIVDDEVHELEPNVKADAAILSPTTGILDAHGLMDHFYREARRRCGVDPLVLDTEVKGLELKGDGYVVDMVSGGEVFSVEARVVINSAGLLADDVAEMAGIDVDEAGYRIHWCKGDYFSLTGRPPARMLVYPPPPRDEASLGIHTVPDLTGRLKFGPNAYYVDEISYRVESDRDEFWRDIVKYLPMIRRENLNPDMSGIRAKLQGPGDPVRDFVIRHEKDRGLPGLINLIGIESPGLTCAPTIAEIVGEMVEEFF
ncbi:MAG: FAD-dependent oxidoreductase, partial [Candidatus Bathyarchaeota archaeon]|nr:FAD-dependent oxidoreductase [Candidatus Bathyarchaeota archaeon]